MTYAASQTNYKTFAEISFVRSEKAMQLPHVHLYNLSRIHIPHWIDQKVTEQAKLNYPSFYSKWELRFLRVERGSMVGEDRTNIVSF